MKRTNLILCGVGTSIASCGDVPEAYSPNSQDYLQAESDDSPKPRSDDASEMRFAVKSEATGLSWVGIEGEVAEWAELKKKQAVSCLVSAGSETLIETNGGLAKILLSGDNETEYYVLRTDADPSSFPNNVVFQDESGRLKVSIKMERLEENVTPITIPWNTGKESHVPRISIILDDMDVPNAGGTLAHNLGFPSFDCR